MKKRVIFTLLLITVSLLYLNLHKKPSKEVETAPKNTLIVAMDQNQLGYFELEGVTYGYWYETLMSYCNQNGLTLEIKPKISDNNAIAMLESGEVDLVLSSTNAIGKNQFKTHPLKGRYNGKYVVVANNSKIKSSSPLPFSFKELKNEIIGDNIVMTNSFTTTKGYNTWLNSIHRSATISHKNPFELLNSCSTGEIDYIICTKNEAKIATINSHNLDVIYEFKESVSSLLLTLATNIELEKSYNNWYNSFVNSEEGVHIAELYIEGKIMEELHASGAIKSHGVISQYDHIIKRKSKELGYDWRFVSAIAYNESRFKPEANSHVGATGIMQIMPRIARSFNVDESQINDPSINVEVALKLLKSIEKSFKFSPNISFEDKTSIILACYNGGLGRIYDARRLAIKMGKNPDSWDDLAQMISLMSKEEIYSDKSVIKYGKFIGTETINFVDKVLKQYHKYCLVASLH